MAIRPVVLLLPMLFGFLRPVAAQGAEEFPAILDDVRLRNGGEEIRPVKVTLPLPPGTRVGDFWIEIQDAAVIARKAAGGDAWKLETGDWMPSLEGWDENFLYVTGHAQVKGTKLPDGLVRVEIGTGKRAADLSPLAGGERVAGERVSVMSVLTGRGHVLVLSRAWISNEAGGENPRTTAIWLTAFKADSSKPAWHCELERPEKETGLLDPGYRSRAEMDLLSWLNDDVLVCAGGPRDAVRRIRLSDGVQAWAIERVWEYQKQVEVKPDPHPGGERGSAEVSFTRMGDEEAASFNALFHCGIVSGPAMTTAADGKVGRIFVVSTRGLRSGLEAECVLTQITPDGKVASSRTMPGFVQNRRFVSDGDGIVWSGFGSVWRTEEWGRLAWYHEPPFSSMSIWSGPTLWVHPVAFEKTSVIQLVSGTEVTEGETRSYHLTLRRYSIKTGTPLGDLVLAIPLRRQPPAPPPDRGLDRDPRDGGAHFLAQVSELKVEADRFVVLISSGDKTGAVEFPLDAVLKLK